MFRLAVEISIAVPLAYLGGMPRIGGRPFGIVCQTTRIADSKLTGEVLLGPLIPNTHSQLAAGASLLLAIRNIGPL